jgi:glycosyltransferase involved in cell wall biosynthesis
MTTEDQPLVSIGVPVYNGAVYLRAALESLLAQTYPHIELIISDNASTDDTQAICQEFVARDSRIRYHRHDCNRGSTFNFSHVLAEARGSLFMWAAHDDFWEPEFVEANVRELVRDPNVVASISRVQFIEIDSWMWQTFQAPHGTAPLMGSTRDSILRVLWNPGTQSRLYALYRTEALRQCVDFAPVWGAETTLVIKALRYGKYAEVPRYLMKRRRGMSSSLRQFVRTHNRTWLGQLLPFWETTEDILKEKHVPRNILVFLFLLKLNLLHAAWYYKVWGEELLASIMTWPRPKITR